MDNKCRHCGCGLFPNEMMICAACYARLNKPDPRQAQGYPSKDEPVKDKR